MSIDEAIAHALEVAELNEKRLDKEGNPYYEKCEKCAAEHRQLAEWLKELKQLREQEPCEDAVSRQAVLETIDDCNKDGLKGIFCSYDDGERFKKYIKNLPSVTPTKCIATVKFSKEDIQELVNEKMKDIVVERKKGKWVNIHDREEWYGDQYRCSLCGKTAITRAENDEILDEAWHLLMSVTEEDGVTTEQANGMLKLMAFFFYKYHGLKKKPEWVENVEARIEESEENK